MARTRRALREALVELAMEKGYEKISIKNLTERADIGYATFFRHYKSKDELLTHYLRAILLDIEQELSPEMTHYDAALLMFDIFEKHRDACLIGLSLPRDHPAMKPIWEAAARLVTARYEARDETAIPLDVSVNHLVHSFVEMVRWWVTEGQAYKLEQMAFMMSELVIKMTEIAALERRSKILSLDPD
ncbi:MAG: TetR/AcrR family transcriptional regulator [Chloroflexi bacterium]|nr:TetR/AcrR family transcriptional regulator [Chloroflexota bacterium]